MEQPTIAVGIMSARELHFVLYGNYRHEALPLATGEQRVEARNGKISWNGQSYNELCFQPVADGNATDNVFELSNVTIGVDFHWERREDQRFEGALKLIVEDDRVTAINLVPIESYLLSVISSEMSATASLNLLKAHAVISRSWLLAQIEKQKTVATGSYSSCTDTPDEYIRWYDREDHLHYDVCADDHCQRYQGINRAITPTVRRAIDETRGMVLMWENEICDARFSKCCGGMLEEFRYCWEEKEYPYLKKRRDCQARLALPDLRQEREASHWISTFQPATCDTLDKNILAQVLNNYDQETIDFYRWKVSYTQEELSALIRRRLGMDFGTVLELIPMERGTSGRISRLKVVGTKLTKVIGKELTIRRALSESHLYSSAFIVNKTADRFTLTGAGWGHGVGLCQIGAAVMGEQGCAFDKILLHYYQGARIEKRY